MTQETTVPQLGWLTMSDMDMWAETHKFLQEGQMKVRSHGTVRK